MTKKLTVLFFVLLGCLFADAQSLTRDYHHRRNHHTHRLPGVNERRLARLEAMREENVALRHRKGPWRAQTVPQTKRGLVLLVQFSDVKLKNGAATLWDNRFNQQGFSQYNHVGSVRDYFIEQSYGLLTIDFDIVGPLTLSNTHHYYGSAPNSDLEDRAGEMVIEALKLADQQVNYADYDWNGNGFVDQVYVIYAGMTSDTEAGYIWPHEWNLTDSKYYGSGSGKQLLDGVYIDTYAVSNELVSETELEGIGTACHEFSHCLGYPDFYDTDYTGGTAGQFWDLLDGGSYNGPDKIGEVPCPYTAYERWTAGWIDLIPLTEPCRVKEMPAINDEGVAYIVKNTGNNNEYYILENRQQTTFGTGNGGHGLMVWHIDYNRSAWDSNSVNSDKNHQRMTFLPADGQVGELQRAYYGYYYNVTSEDEAGDPYPGSQNISSVQPLTWFISERNGTKTHANLIHNISESADGKISFTYGDYKPLDVPELALPTDITGLTFTANWLPVEGATSYTLQVEEMTGEEVSATILEEDFSGFKNAGTDASVSNSVVSRFTQTAGWKVSNVYGTGSDAVRVGTASISGYILTPALSCKEGTLAVEFDAAYYNTDGSSIVVTVLNSAQTVVATQTVSLTDNRATYRCTFEDVPSGCTVKFASTAAKKRLYLYNVKIMDMSGTGSIVTTYTGLTTTSHVVESTSAELYYYRVQAVCEDGTSEWSDWIDVDIASAICDLPKNDLSEGNAANAASSANGCYDISGRRLQRLPRQGLYIRNGKVHVAP